MIKLLYKTILILFIGTTTMEANFIVAIDPGHTIKRFGAVSSSGVTEYTYNIAISKILLSELNNTQNIDAFIINPTGGKIKLKERTSIATEHNADVFISLHHDSVQLKYLKSEIIHGQKLYSTHKFKGYSLFVSKKNKSFEKSLTLATDIAQEIKNSGFIPTLHHAEKIKGENRTFLDKNLGVYQFDDLIVLKTINIPSVLIECGVIVNPNEEKNIQNTSYHYKIAKAIKAGIINYMKAIKFKD